MGPFRDLPADIVELIFEHLAHSGQQAQLYTVACAAQTLAALTQVLQTCKDTAFSTQSSPWLGSAYRLGNIHRPMNSFACRCAEA